MTRLAEALVVALAVSASVLASTSPAHAGEGDVVNPPIVGAGGCYSENVSLGQSFTATTNGTLTGIAIFVFQGSRETTLTVYEGDGPNGRVLASQDVLLTADGELKFFPLEPSVPVVAGNSYSFAIANGTCGDGEGFLLSVGRDYAGGAAFRNAGAPAVGFSDLAFWAKVDPYPFTGFFGPVDNAPVVNTVKAGSAVPVQFSLGSDRGLNIFNTNGAPTFTVTSCTNGATDPIETVVASSRSGLSYDPATGLYAYVWKTAKNLADACGTLELNLNDGSSHIAYFKFT